MKPTGVQKEVEKKKNNELQKNRDVTKIAKVVSGRMIETCIFGVTVSFMWGPVRN